MLAVLLLFSGWHFNAVAQITDTDSPVSSSWHTATLLPNGKVLIALGTGFGGGEQYLAQLYDPATHQWSTTDAPNSVSGPGTSAVLMKTGEVLLFGGADHDDPEITKRAATVFNPITERWREVGHLQVERHAGQSATLLDDGRVLVAGGERESSGGLLTAMRTAEWYDPALSSWARAGLPNRARAHHTATRLQSGKVLITGGTRGSNSVTETTEIYDPATNSWSNTANMLVARRDHRANLLQNGKVVVTGGVDHSGNRLTSCELYDPATDSWAMQCGGLGAAGGRSDHTVTMLPSGELVLIGGGPDASIKIFNPDIGIWFGSNLLTVQEGHSATLLANGDILIVDGDISSTRGSASIFHSDITRGGNWSTTASMARPRALHTATLLPSGHVLVVGGQHGTTAHRTVERYNHLNNTWSDVTGLDTARFEHTATLLPTGEVLVVGGFTRKSLALEFLASAEIYNPQTNLWRSAGSSSIVRVDHTATLLNDGTVMVAGGRFSNGSRSDRVEIYDPVENNWTLTDNLNVARSAHTTTLMPNGSILVAGGHDGSTSLASVEQSNGGGPWVTTTALTGARSGHSANVLGSGEVIVFGGFGASGYVDYGETSVSSLNFITGNYSVQSWTGSVATPPQATGGHTATTLPNGDVLVAGGNNISSVWNTSFRYDPVYQLTTAFAWTEVNNQLATARTLHTATLLKDGRVLVAGGLDSGFSNSLTSAELFEIDLGFDPSLQPQINTSPDVISPGDTFSLGGDHFIGASEGSHSTANASTSDHPIVKLRRQDNGATAFIGANSAQGGTPDAWSETTARLEIPAGFANGPAWLTLIVNGIPSEAVYTSIGFEEIDDSSCFVIKASNGNVITFCL